MSNQAGDLRRHLKSHSGDNSNKCNQCDYTSPCAYNLRAHLKTHSGEKPNNCNQCNVIMYFQKQAFCIHVLLQVTFLRKCFLTVIIFVLLRWQWLNMAFDNMGVHIIHSVKSLWTYLACEHSIFVHRDFTVPCKVSFFLHISTFVTILFLMPMSVVLAKFGFGHKCFFNLCTGVLILTWQRLAQNWHYIYAKK